MSRDPSHATRRAPWPARLFAGLGVIITVAGALTAVGWRIADPVPIVPNTFGFADASLVSFGILGTTFAAVGAILMVRLPRNAIGWVMVVIGVCYALAALAAAITFSAVADGRAGAGTAAVAGWWAVLFSTIGGLVFALGLIFPTGRGHTPAWDRFLRIAAVFLPFFIVFGFLIRPGPLQVFPSIDNPFGIGPDLRSFLGPQPSAVIAGSVVWFAPILVWSIASRYRMSDAVGRQQLKWFIVSMLVAIGGIAFAAIASVVTDRPPEAGLAVFGFAGALVPAAIGIAILRHHLYDIDRLISRTISYAVVTAILVVTFGSVVIGLQAVTSSFLPKDSSIFVAASTLVVFALFQPLVRRVRAGVDRRFDRGRYDADRTASAFAERLRWETDMERVTGDLARTADAAVVPRGLAIWLRPRGVRR